MSVKAQRPLRERCAFGAGERGAEGVWVEVVGGRYLGGENPEAGNQKRPEAF